MILTIDEIRVVLARKGDLHRATAAKAFGIPEDQVTKEQRQWAKQSNHRCLYDPDFWKEVYGVNEAAARERNAAKGGNTE